MAIFANVLKLGIISEYKIPPDRRVAFTPSQCKLLKSQFPDLDLTVEASPHRIFDNNAYLELGIQVANDLSDCQVLFGIKEVPPEKLLTDKTYFFFSHTIKMQPHNQEMLKGIIKKRITLIDYECLQWANGTRVLGFGRYAGLVGTYETLKAYGLKTRSFELKSASNCQNYLEMENILKSVIPIIKSHKLKIVVAGGGRVSSGAEELLRDVAIRKVSYNDYLSHQYDETVYTVLDIHQLYQRKDGELWNHDHFFKNHEMYQSSFKPFTSISDILINGVYWDATMPSHFTKNDTKSSNFKIKVIGDISCDVEGSIPITLHETCTDYPVMGWDPLTQSECEPFTENGIDIMAISNLPSELPADASEGFGSDLLKVIIPELLKPKSIMLENATICKNGHLTEKYKYLTPYIS